MRSGRNAGPFGADERTERQLRPFGRRAFGYLCVGVLVGLSACAQIWGFDDLGGGPDGGGAGGTTMIVQIGTGGAGPPLGSGGSGSGGAPGGAGGASSGGAGGSGAGGLAGTGGVLGTGGTRGMGGATGQGGAAGMSGAGGKQGTGGAQGMGGAQGAGGVQGMGGAQGTGGKQGIGGAQGMGGAQGTGGKQGVGGAQGIGGAQGMGGAAGCGPTTCANGCCAAGRCITPTAAQQCGTRGAACVACGSCQVCGSTGACAVDPASNWVVRCASAQLTALPPTGATWDPAGVAGDGIAPDPFCQFEKPAGTIDATTGAATRTVNDSFTATWNQTVTAGNTTITAAELMSTDTNAWRVWVGDSEFNGRGTLACQVRPPLQATALVDGQLTVTNTLNCVSFTVTLVCQP